jgi:hypothetical protein
VNVGVSILAEPDGVSLVVGADSRRARRELGAVAWVMLEAVALAGEFDAEGRWVAVTNARALASELGIGKDRAAAALATLRAAGLVVAHAGRQYGSARFAPSRYEVRLPVSHHTDTATTTPDRPTRRRAPRTRARVDELTLFKNLVASPVQTSSITDHQTHTDASAMPDTVLGEASTRQPRC